MKSRAMRYDDKAKAKELADVKRFNRVFRLMVREVMLISSDITHRDVEAVAGLKYGNSGR